MEIKSLPLFNSVKTKVRNLKQTNFLRLDTKNRCDAILFNGETLVKRNSRFYTVDDFNVIYNKQGVYVMCTLSEGTCTVNDGDTEYTINFSETVTMTNVVVRDGSISKVQSGYSLSHFLINGKTETVDKPISFNNWTICSSTNDVHIQSDSSVEKKPNVFYAIYEKTGTNVKVYRAFVLIPYSYTYKLPLLKNVPDSNSSVTSAFSLISNVLSNISTGESFQNVSVDDSISPFGTVSTYENTSIFSFDSDGCFTIYPDKISTCLEDFNVEMIYEDTEFTVEIDVSNMKLNISYDVPDKYPLYADLSMFSMTCLTLMESVSTERVELTISRYASTSTDNVVSLCLSDVSYDTCDGYLVDGIYYKGTPSLSGRFTAFKDKESFRLVLYTNCIIMDNYTLYTINNQPISGCLMDLFPEAEIKLNDSNIVIGDDFSYNFDPSNFDFSDDNSPYVELALQNTLLRIEIENLSPNVYDFESVGSLKPLGYPSMCLYNNLLIENGTNFFDIFKVNLNGTVDVNDSATTGLCLIYNSYVKFLNGFTKVIYMKKGEYAFEDYENSDSVSYSYGVAVERGTIRLTIDIGYLTLGGTSYIIVNSERVSKVVKFIKGSIVEQAPEVRYSVASIPDDISFDESQYILSAVVNNLGGFITGINPDMISAITSEIKLSVVQKKLFIQSIPEGRYPFWVNNTKNILTVTRGSELQLKNATGPSGTTISVKDYIISGSVSGSDTILCDKEKAPYTVTDSVSGQEVSFIVNVYDPHSSQSVNSKQKNKYTSVQPSYSQTPQLAKYFCGMVEMVLDTTLEYQSTDPLHIDNPTVISDGTVFFKIYPNGSVHKLDTSKMVKKNEKYESTLKTKTFYGDKLKISLS